MASPMFRDFSFGSASPPAYFAYEAERATMNVSPTSRSDTHPASSFARPPIPPCSMGDLASKLNQQSLRIDSLDSSYPPSAPLSPASDDSCSDCHEGPSPRPTYSRISASVMRMQRQSSARMHCSSSYVRDISRLVHMIENEEQCTVGQPDRHPSSASSTHTSSRSSSRPSRSITPPSSPSSCSPHLSADEDEDEGLDMDFDSPHNNIKNLINSCQWRSQERRDSCIRVTKHVRMRKRMSSKVEKRR